MIAAPRTATLRTMLPRLAIAIAAFGMVSCSQAPDPYTPRRPYFSEDAEWKRQLASELAGAFPERTILLPREESPTNTLARIESIYRSIARSDIPDDEWIETILKSEIDSIRAEIGRLDLGAGSVMRLRLGDPSALERSEFRRAAELHVRWALARMRGGDADERVKGADALREAMDFDPENPIIAVIQASYLDLAGFRSNAIRCLDDFDEKCGPSDLVDLMRLRKRERIWKITGFEDELDAARSLADAMAVRRGGWPAAPPWLRLERARLRYFADSVDVAASDAREVIEAYRRGAEPDTLTAFQSHLLLGAIHVRELEFSRADSSFAAAMRVGRSHPGALELISLLDVPWDLWSDEERMEFDGSSHRADHVRYFWRANDPILATPDVLEDRAEYRRRVSDAWFLFSGIDIGNPGPWTDAGRAVLRFGIPASWNRLGSRSLEGFSRASLDYSVNQTWEFSYRLRTGDQLSDRKIVFQDPLGLGRFAATDSLRGASWPPYWFNFDFGGRAYRADRSLARFRDWDGRTRLIVSFDTLLPNYSIRFPLAGFRFEGSAAVEAAVLRKETDNLWKPTWVTTVDLDSETAFHLERDFMRRSGTAALTGVDRGVYRIASLLRLRDLEGRTVAIAADNGEPIAVPGFGWRDLDASDLLLTASVEGLAQEDVERKIREGLVVYGPDPSRFEVVPRASNRFFPGEDLAFYLEVYNLDHRDGIATIDMKTTLEKLHPDGTVEYAVTSAGSTSSLTKYGIDQWNIGRTLGLGGLALGEYNLVIEIWDRQARKRLERTSLFNVVTPEEMIELYNWKQLDPPSTRLDKEPHGAEG
jgi:hypothetical protein